ncbi:MAG: AsmA family protein [Desulfobacterales bacterium]|jgi:uncharacterized protein involved in outer membrane biogenesis
MRWKWFFGICALLIFASMTVVYVFIATYDYNQLKPHIAQMVKDATGRELNLTGRLDLEIGFSPALVVTDIAFANAAWGSRPQMVAVKKLEAQFRLLPLLQREVKVKHISLAGVEVLLETDPKGKGNWNAIAENRKDKSTGAYRSTGIDIDDIHIENLRFIFHDGRTGSKRHYTLIRLDLAGSENEDEVTLDLKAEYNSQPITLSGKIGRIHNLFKHQPFPLNLSGTFSNATVKVAGAIDNLPNLAGIDLKLDASGQDLSEIGSIIGQKLPKTDQFALKGQLTGSAKTLSLKEARCNANRGSLQFTANGAVKDLLTLSDMDLNSSLKGKNLQDFGEIIEEKLPATDAFAVEGRLTGSTDALSLRDVQANARQGSLGVSATGEVQDLITLSGLNLQVKGSGKSLAEIGRIIEIELPATDEFEVQGRLAGSTNGLSLMDAQGSAKRGGLNLAVNGGVEELPALNGINLKLKASGKELAEIGPLVGAELPELGPFDVSGKLSGSAKTIALDDFSAMVDNSDFNGQARVEFLERPKLTVRLESSVIDFTALMKSLEKDEKKPADKDQQQRRLFSDAPLPLDLLKKMDADIVLKARNMHSKDVRLEFGHMTLKLQDHDFSIDTLEATYKETKISGNLQIKAGSPSRVATHFLVQGFNLGDFLKETGKNDRVRAIIDIAAHGKSRGDSARSLMANLDGAIGVVMGEGYLTKHLDLLSTGLTGKVFQIWKPPRAVDQIKCAVVQFDIKEGVAASQAFVFDTGAGLLTGDGEINLGTEKIHFLLVPKPARPDFRILTNLRVSGSVLEPSVGVDKVSALTRGARALSFLAVGPLGLLAPFVHLRANKSHPCDVPSIGQLGLRTPDSH